MKKYFKEAILRSLTLQAVVLPALLCSSPIAAIPIPQDLLLEVRETAGVSRAGEVVRSGIPLPQSLDVWDPSTLVVVDGSGVAVPAEFRVLARWHAGLSDATAPIQWLLVSFPATVGANGSSTYRLVTDGSAGSNPTPPNALVLSQNGSQFSVDTGVAVFEFGADPQALFDEIRLPSGTVLVQGGQLTARANSTDSVHTQTRRAWVEHSGPLSAVVVVEGQYDLPPVGGGGLGSLRRYVFRAGSPTAVVRHALAWEGDIDGQASPSNAVLVEQVRDTLGLSLAGTRSAMAVGAFGAAEVTATVNPGQTARVRQKLRARRPDALSFDVDVAGAGAGGVKADGGMLAVSTAQGTVAVALRQMHRYEPQALRVLADGHLAVDWADDTAWLAYRQGMFATLAVSALPAGPTRGELDRQLWAPLNRPLRAWPEAAWFVSSEAVDEFPVGNLPVNLVDYDLLVSTVLQDTSSKLDQKGLAGLMTFGVYPRTWGGSFDEIGGDTTWDGLFWNTTWTDYHNTLATAPIWAMRSGEVEWLDDLAFPGALRTLHTQVMQCGPGDSYFYCGQAPAGYGGYRFDFNGSHAYFDNLFLYYWLTGDSTVPDILQRGASGMRDFFCATRPAAPCTPQEPPPNATIEYVGRVVSQWIAAFRFVGLASDDASFLQDYEGTLAQVATQNYAEPQAGGIPYGFLTKVPHQGAGTYGTDHTWMTSLYDMNNLYRLQVDTQDAPIGVPAIEPSRMQLAWARTLRDWVSTVYGNGTAGGTWANALFYTFTGSRLGGTLTNVSGNATFGEPHLWDTGKANLIALLLRAGQQSGDSSLVDLGRDLTQITLGSALADGSPLGKVQGLYIARLHAAVQRLAEGAPPPPLYSLDVVSAGSGSGTVTSSPAGIGCGADCQEDYLAGTTVVLTATPQNGSYFVGWSGDADCSDGSVTMTGPRSCTATFDLGTPPTFDLTISKSGAGTGTVSSTPVGIDCGADCQEAYTLGTTVTLTAAPDTGSVFTGWSGHADCSDGQLTMDVDKSCTATFQIGSVTAGLVAAFGFEEGAGTVTLDVSPYGNDGTITGAGWAAGYFGNALSFDGVDDWVTVQDASSLDLSAGMTLEAWVRPSSISGWIMVGGKETSTDLAFSLLVNDASATAPAIFVHTDTENGATGSTQIPTNTWSHLAGTYDGTFLRLYVDGTEVGLVPATGTVTQSNQPVRIGGNSSWGNFFSGLIDEVRIYDRALSATEIQADMATAVGSPPPPGFTLTVTPAGSGSGIFSSSPAGIDCGADCLEQFGAGTTVSLTATADPGSVFAGWTGHADCADGVVVMVSSIDCIGTFDLSGSPTTHTLTISLAGAGTGTVVSSPPGIDCGSDCQEAYNEGTIVSLVAAPDTGSVFSGWTGDPDCSDGSVSMNSDLTCVATFGPGSTVSVATPSELIAALSAVSPGDVISLAPGIYDISQNLLADTPGTASQPIVVRAAQLGDALVRFDAVEGFKVSAPHWTFENLDIEGVCASHSTCEHAFHIFGDADFTTIRGSRLHEYNAPIKANGVGGLFPDDALIEHNELSNSSARNTSNPVALLDIVGGRRWIVRANLFADFEKGGGNGISYAAFLKGNSRDGVFERNLVMCERNHSGGIRLGLSFGGGGTSPDSICEGGTCTPEHSNGMMRNNVIVNCPADVGIYLNEAASSSVYNNTIYNSLGIDVRFAASTVDVRNNIMSGSVIERDGGIATTGSNLEGVTAAQFSSWFSDPSQADFGLVDGTAVVDQGELLAAVTHDYCQNSRTDGQHDIGAVEYDGASCDTTQPGGVGGPPPPTASLTISRAGSGSGTVTSSPTGIDCGADCAETYGLGTQVDLTAMADPGSVFSGWSGDTDCADGSVTLGADVACIATFDLQTFDFTVSKAGSGSGTVTSTPPGIDCGADCAETYDFGTVIGLTATADPGSVFAGWGGDADCADGAVTLGANVACTATFDLQTFDLAVSKAGSGSGTVTSAPTGIDCGADCAETYDFGTVIALTATADPGSVFSGWSGDADCADGSVTLGANVACTATFDLQTFDLAVSKAGSGSGIVTSSPAGIDCGADCTETYDFGTQVALTATADSGSVFASWSGDADCADGSVTVGAAVACTATFDLVPAGTFVLTVSRIGAGSGVVASAPTGIDCGGDCQEAYDENTVVQLTATESQGSDFAGWGGDPDCSDGTVTLSSDLSCTATFDLQTFDLAVSKAGSGSGTVTSAPAGIDCGADCAETYDFGTQVALTATTDPGSVFSGWSGDADCADGAVILGANVACNATFDLQTFDLAVSKDGNGSGIVTSAPAGIDCGADCAETYDFGTQVALTATADPGSVFSGWSGDADCADGAVILGANVACNATFDLQTFDLAVSKDGNGSGIVTSAPAGIDCGADCTETYDFGTQVALTATADPSSVFSGWSGDADCADGVVTLVATRACIATFDQFVTFFSDGFESGDTSAWSSQVGGN